MLVSDNAENALSEYLKNLFDEFSENRKPIAKEAQKDLDAFKSISNDIWKKGEAKGWRSDTFVPMTHEKVMAAYAVILDTVLQEGQIPIQFEQSPYEEELMQDLPQEQQDELQEAIDEATDLVKQQLMDCNADRQFGKNILSCLIYSETYAKYHTHVVKREGWKKISMAQPGMENQDQYDRYEPFISERTQPAWKYISWWSIFRDIEEDDMQKSAGVIEMEMITAYELRKLKGAPFYLNDQIDGAIKAAKQPGNEESNIEDKDDMPPYLRDIMHRKKTIRRLFCWCRIPRHIAEDFENTVIKKSGDDVSSYWIDTEFADGDEVEIHAEMADEHVIRYARVPEGERPYERAILEDLLDHPTGLSMPRKLRHPQRGANGSVRAVEDNLKLSANIMTATMGEDAKIPTEFEPGKNIKLPEMGDRIGDHIQQFIVQDVSQSLLPILGIFERYADEAASMPKIMQGQTHAKEKPDTLGEINILQSNSMRYAGTIIRNLDNGLIEPMGNRFHKFNMEDPEQTKGKGNFIARPLGYSSFQDKIVRVKKIMQGLFLVMKFPELQKETKIRAILKDIWQFNDVDPEKYIKSEEEKRQDAEDSMKAMMMQMKLKDQLQDRALAKQEQVKDADLQRDIEKETAKSALKKDEKGQEFDQNLFTKIMDMTHQGAQQVGQPQ